MKRQSRMPHWRRHLPGWLSRMTRKAPGLAHDSGATAIEYSIIACLVALGIVAGANFAGNGLNALFTVVGTKMQSATDKATNNTGN